MVNRSAFRLQVTVFDPSAQLSYHDFLLNNWAEDQPAVMIACGKRGGASHRKKDSDWNWLLRAFFKILLQFKNDSANI